MTSLVPCTHVEKPRQHLGENPSIEKSSFVKAPVSFPAAKVRRRPKRCAECLPSNRVREKGRKQGPPRSQETVLRGPPLLLGFLLAKLDESRDAHRNSRHATGKNSTKLCEVETIRPVAEEDFLMLTALDICDQGTFGLYKGLEALEQCLELKRKWHRAQSFANSIEEARAKSLNLKEGLEKILKCGAAPKLFVANYFWTGRSYSNALLRLFRWVRCRHLPPRCAWEMGLRDRSPEDCSRPVATSKLILAPSTYDHQSHYQQSQHPALA